MRDAGKWILAFALVSICTLWIDAAITTAYLCKLCKLWIIIPATSAVALPAMAWWKTFFDHIDNPTKI